MDNQNPLHSRDKQAACGLLDYMQQRRMSRTQMAKLLGWSVSDLGDSLSGRKKIGPKRRKHIAQKLGRTSVRCRACGSRVGVKYGCPTIGLQYRHCPTISCEA